MTSAPDPLPGSTFTARQVRLLKISVAIMTALLLLGMIAVFYGMARQAAKLGSSAPARTEAAAGPTPYLRTLDLGKGQLQGVAAAGGLIILHWKGEGNDSIVTIDPRNGHELGRIQVPRG
ncbi:MAG: hypothetical protein WBX25_17230 [Rhodomicrobium sp.]